MKWRSGVQIRCQVKLKTQFNSVQSLSCVWLFATSWTAARQAPCPSPTQSLLKLMFIQLVMPSNHLILCCPLLLQPPIPPSIRVFSFLFLILFYFLNLQYCIGFAIYRNESTTGIHAFPIPNPPHGSVSYGDHSLHYFWMIKSAKVQSSDHSSLILSL